MMINDCRFWKEEELEKRLMEIDCGARKKAMSDEQ